MMNVTLKGMPRRGFLLCNKLIACAVFAAGVVSAAAANEWYVDDDNYGKAGLDGKSAATAWGTLQDAHDNAAAGDTVYVLPGTYDRGETVNVTGSYEHTNRLAVTKKLFFRATGTKAETEIVGRLDPNTGVNGPAAIRCVFVATSGSGTEFYNFTFRDGGASNGGTDDNGSIGTPDMGGALYAFNGNTGVYLVDCDIRNCWGYWGGGMRGGTAIRCFFDNCGGKSFGQTCTGSKLWCCVIKNNNAQQSTRPVLGNGVLAVNCTLAFCQGNLVARGCKLYNCVFTRQANGVDATVYPGFQAPMVTNLYGTANTTADNILAAPAIDDFRLVTGAPGVGGGETLFLTNGLVKLPSGVALTDFSGNPIDLTKPTCDAGAVQGAVTPAGGVMTFSSSATINGYKVIRYPYLWSVTVPEMITVRPNSSENFFRWRPKRVSSYSGADFRYLDLNGTTSVFLPTVATDVMTFEQGTADVTLYCNPKADAATADGSSDHPFRTLQAAMDHITALKTQNVSYLVLARPGEYAEGGAYDYGTSNRVVIPVGNGILLKSTGGAAATIIRGGTEMRCVSFATNGVSNLAIQGFTLADGHAAASGDDGASGGGVSGSTAKAITAQVLDCVFTNCTATCGAAGSYALFVRCRAVDCKASNGIFFGGYLVSSLVDPSCSEHKLVLDTYFSTIPGVTWTPGTDRYLYGNVYSGLTASKSVYWDSIAGSLSGILDDRKGLTVADPFFADASAGDWRLAATSPAVAGLQIPEVGSATWTDWLSRLVSYGDSDLDGNPIRITNGVPMAGCFQVPVHGLYVGTPAYGGIKISGGKYGVNDVTDDLAVTVSADSATAKRPCVGLLVGGVTNLFATSPSVTVTAAQVRAAGGDLAVTPIYPPDWYVSETGNDANDGFTPETAKKNLSTMLENEYLLPGDTVHVAAGRYDDGVNVVDGKRFRAAVPEGVSLVGATDGETLLVGEKDTATGDAYGFGPAAVRGVRLESHASVKNVTIANCWTEANGDGAGVVAAVPDLSDRSAYCVENCLVTNCWAGGYGGGACGVRLVKCRLFNNRAQTNGGTTYECEIFGTITDYSCQGGENASANNYFVTAVNSTFGEHSQAFDSTGSRAVVGNSTGVGNTSVLKNCIILGTIRVIMQPTVNCVYVYQAMGSTYDQYYKNSRKATAAEIALDANYRPIIGKSVAIDYGDADAYESARSLLGDADVLGTQRIYNGRIDAGAVEADWRETYARAISSSRRFIVTDASTNVVKATDLPVTVGPDGILTGTWTDGQACDCTVTVKVSGTGATVRCGDESRFVSASAAEQSLTFTGTSSSTSIVFDNSGNDGTLEIVGSTRLSGLMLIVR